MTEPLVLRLAPRRDDGSTGGIRTLVVGDQRVFAEALMATLEDEVGVSVVRSASWAELAVESIDRWRPDVALVDFEDDDGAAVRLIGELRERQPDTFVIAVTASDSHDVAVQAVEAGAQAIVPRTGPLTDLLEAVHSGSAGESVVPRRLLRPILEALSAARSADGATEAADVLGRLTAREHEVLELLAAGLDRRSIADRLAVSVHTVRTHVTHILHKLGAGSAVEAVSLALRSGLELPAPGPSGIRRSTADR